MLTGGLLLNLSGLSERLSGVFDGGFWSEAGSGGGDAFWAKRWERWEGWELCSVAGNGGNSVMETIRLRR
jgi:hypothetical protein